MEPAEQNETTAEEIVEVKTFTNSRGEQITAFFPYPAAGGRGSAEFHGIVGLQTQMGPIEFEFEFPPHYSLEQCFKEFKEIANKAVEEKRKEAQERNRIVTPGSSSGNIIIP